MILRFSNLIALIIALIGLLFIILHWPNGDLMLLVGLCALAILSLIGAFKKVPSIGESDTDKRKQKMQKLTTFIVGATLSCMFISVLFSLLSWMTAININKMAFIFFIISLNILAISGFKVGLTSHLKAQLPKLLIIGGIVTAFYFNPFLWLDNREGDAESTRLLKELLQDPGNDSLNQVYDDRRRFYFDSGNADGWRSLQE